MVVVRTQTGVAIIVSGQGLPGPPGPSGSGGDVEDLTTQGAVGSVPTSDGAGGLDMTVPSGSGNVVSPGGETAGNITKFTGSGTIAEIVVTETELITLTDKSIADDLHDHTHAQLQGIGIDDHHPRDHSIESHAGISSTGPQIDAHLASSANPHFTSIANIGSGTLPQLNTAVGVTLDVSSDSRTPTGGATGDLSGAYPNPTVDGLQGQAVSGTTPTEGQVLTSTSGVWTPEDPTGGGGGEANTISSAGTGVSLLATPPKVGVDLQTAGLNSLSTAITVAADTPNDNVDLNLVPGNIAHSTIAGVGSNTHAQIDTHLAATTNPHSVTAAQAGAEPSGAIATHAALGDVHHAEAHTILSHDTDATGAELTELTDASETTLHSHAASAGADTTAIHRDVNSEFGGITDDPTPPGTGRLIAETAAGVKFRVDIGNLPTGGGGESNDLANAGTGISGVATPSKVGINLQARGHAAASSMVIVAADAPNENVTYDLAPDEIPIITRNTGFENRVDSDISKVDGTRTFTIAPAVTDYVVWVEGVKYLISSSQNVVWDDTTGAKTFYIDNTGTLQVQNSSITGADGRTKGLIAFIYWDTATSVTAAFTEERHGYQQDPDTREYTHEVLAAQWVSGLALSITSIDGDGDTDAHGHVSMSGGEFFDENLKHTIVDGSPQDLTPIAQILVYYLTGPVGAPVLKQRAPTNFPFINDSDSVWTGRVPFNELSGGTTWQLTEVTNNNHVLVHLFGTGGLTNPVVAFQGQNEYSTISAARAGAGEELNTLIMIGLGSKEIVPLSTFILQTSNGMSNLAKAAIMSTATADYVDWRATPRAGAGGLTVNEHDALANRENLANHSLYLDHGGTRPMTGDLQMGNNDVVDFISTAGTGASASLKDFFTGSLSAGHDTGGGITLQGAPANSVDVAAGTGLLRSIDDATDELRSIGWDLFNSGTLAVDTETYFGVEWNAGTPQVIAKGTDTWNYQNEFPLGNAIRDSTGIHLTPNPHSIGDAPGETARRFFETLSISRDRKLGGLILGETGSRNITLSSGAFWSRLNRIIVAELDTSVSGSVDFYYETAPSVFAVDAARTQWPNTQYGNGTTLTTMTNGRYAVLWWYLGFDGDVVAQYGRNEYTKIADAEDEPVPNTAPLRIANHAGLVARTVFQKDASTATEIGSVFSNVFASLGVQSHPDLTNINPDDHHSEAHTLESHTAVATTGAQLDGHLASSANPHSTSISNIGSGTLGELNTALSVTLDVSTASRPPNGSASGDLSASFPGPTVAKIQGEDISATTPTEGQVLTHLSGTWTAAATAGGPPTGTAGGDLNGTYPNPGVDDGADSTAIHDDQPGEIVAITEKTIPLGDDEFVMESAADSNAKRSVKLRAIAVHAGGIPCPPPQAIQTTASPVLRFPKALLITRIHADFSKATATGTFTYILKSGANIGSLSTVGTVSVTATNSSGTVGSLTFQAPANSVFVVECTAIGTHTGADHEKVCMIHMEAEID